MTGFGAAEGSVGDARVTVEVRTVNHRFFNSSIKLPGAYARWEGEVRDALRRRIARGHVTLSARVERATDSTIRIDEPRFAAYVEQLRDLQERYGLSDDLDVSTVLRLPDVVSGDAPEQDAGTVAELVSIAEKATAALGEMRQAEGKQLAKVVSDRLALVEAALERIAARAPERQVEQKARLERGVAELLQGAAVDPQRLAQEIAIMADRLDVSEEIDRFGAHIRAFRATLADNGAEPVGKRLSFLLQELLREANTTGSKANDSLMLADVVAVKEELERIREQVENME